MYSYTYRMLTCMCMDMPMPMMLYAHLLPDRIHTGMGPHQLS